MPYTYNEQDPNGHLLFEAYYTITQQIITLDNKQVTVEPIDPQEYLLSSNRLGGDPANFVAESFEDAYRMAANDPKIQRDLASRNEWLVRCQANPVALSVRPRVFYSYFHPAYEIYREKEYYQPCNIQGQMPLERDDWRKQEEKFRTHALWMQYGITAHEVYSLLAASGVPLAEIAAARPKGGRLYIKNLKPEQIQWSQH